MEYTVLTSDRVYQFHCTFLSSSCSPGHPYCEMCCGRRGACGRSVVTVTAAAPNWAVAGGASATAGDQLDSYEVSENYVAMEIFKEFIFRWYRLLSIVN